MRRAPREWTSRDDELLTQFHGEGKDDVTIAYIIGRNRTIVNKHRHMLGLPTQGQGGSKGYHHTPEAKARIGAASRQRHLAKAERLGWSAEAGRKGREKLAKTRFRRPPPGPERQYYHKLRDALGPTAARRACDLRAP